MKKKVASFYKKPPKNKKLIAIQVYAFWLKVSGYFKSGFLIFKISQKI